MLLGEKVAFKVFKLENLKKNSLKRSDFFKEYVIPSRAKEEGLDMLVPLKAVYFSDSLITLAFPRYFEDLAAYFHRKQENAKELSIFLQTALHPTGECPWICSLGFQAEEPGDQSRRRQARAHRL